ncbi:hypothetical protein Q3G72_005481 [Acer saccharum]|nr:hypothetical protein Q3G72_005481 [Acer saccharum]
MMEKISKSVVACKPVNLSELMISLTSTIICRVAFGKRYEDEGIERSRFQALLSETQAMFTSFFFSDHFPFMGWIDRFTGLISRLEKNFKNFDTFYQELIDEHLDANRPKTEHEDILDVLLQLRKERLFKIDLTMDHIKGVLMNVFVGGTDTGSASVIWIMTYLMKNPKAMKKAQEEVRNLIGNNDGMKKEDLDFDALPGIAMHKKNPLQLTAKNYI